MIPFRSKALRIALVGLFAAFANNLAPPAHADHPMRYEARTTPGGLPFQHRFDPLTPYATVTFGWSTPRDAKGQEGLRPMLGSLLMNGVYPQQPTEYFEQLADLYASTSITAGDDQFVAEAKAPAKQLPEALALVVRALRSGAPNAKTFRRTRNNFINGEKQAEKNPLTQVSRSSTMYVLGDHPLTRALDPKRYDTVRLEDIAAWRRTAFEQGPLQVVVSGRLTVDEAAAMLDKAFADWPRTPSRQRETPALVAAKPSVIAVAAQGNQAIVQMSAPTARIEPREGVVAQMALAILGAGPSSRLFNAVRAALGSTYGASASQTVIGPEQRVVTLSANVDPKQADASIEALKRAYADWYENGVTAAEVATQRERMITAVASSYRDPSSANRLVMPLLLQGRSIDELHAYDTRVAAITRDDLNAFIKSRFPKPADLTLVVGTPEGGTYTPAQCQVATWRDVQRVCAAKQP